MEQVKEQKHSKLKKGLATALALITVSTTIFGALSIFKPKNIVFAEEVTAQVSETTKESITIKVNTLPADTIYKEFNVKLEAIDGARTLKESNIERYIAYTIAEDYSSITVECKEAFNGGAKITVSNAKDPSLKDTITFKYARDAVLTNYTLNFQRWTGVSSNPQFVENEIFYLDGGLNVWDDERFAERQYDGGVYDENFVLEPKYNEMAPLYFDGQYRMNAAEHIYGKGDASKNINYYWHFLKYESALESLNFYSEMHPTSSGPVNFYFNDVWFNTNKRIGNFNFSQMILFENNGSSDFAKEALNTLYAWMHENPDKSLVVLCHDDVETRQAVLNGEKDKELRYSYFYNKYFSQGNLPTGVEINETEYIFNK